MGKADRALLHLQKDIQTAFTKPTTKSNPFEELRIFHNARQKINSDQVAIHHLLLNALAILEVDRKEQADLLRRYLLQEETIQAIALSRNVSVPTIYRKKDQAVRQLALILQAQERQAQDNWQAQLEQQLDLPPMVQLFGIEPILNQLLDKVVAPQAPWVVCIDGIGGIGKTALANALVRHSRISGHFHNLAWVSAKQQSFSPVMELRTLPGPALQVGDLIDRLLKQLDSSASSSLPPEQRKALLFQLIKKASHLIVVDNLETVIDYEALLPLLVKLANPSKVLITSRHRLQNYEGVSGGYSQLELNLADTLRLIKYEAEVKGITAVADASDDQLTSIYDVVGGHPLALKLIVGQMEILPLPHILNGLKQAAGKPIDELYEFIYWQAWNLLDAAAQTSLLMMPVAQNGTLEQLMAATQLCFNELSQALQKLFNLSLVQVRGPIEQRRYAIHRLTETFLLNELIGWKQPISE